MLVGAEGTLAGAEGTLPGEEDSLAVLGTLAAGLRRVVALLHLALLALCCILQVYYPFYNDFLNLNKTKKLFTFSLSL